MISHTSQAGSLTNNINSEQAQFTFFGPFSTSQTSQEFTIDQFPYCLAGFNLGSDDVITVQQVVGQGVNEIVSTYQPVFGAAQLDINTSKYTIEHPGRYKLYHTGSSPLGTFTVIGAPYSSTTSGIAQLSAALQAAVKGIVVTGISPIQVTGSGTQTSPYIISTPDITVDASDTLTKNIFIGGGTLIPITLTDKNVFIGWDVQPSVIADDNVAVGTQAATGTPNISHAVCIGGLSGNQNNNGTDLTAIGYRAGHSSRKGTYLGSFAGDGQTTFNNIIVINNPTGVALVATQENQVVIGDNTITQMVTAGSIIQGGVISASDERLKTDIESEQDALEKINNLSPVTFRWDKEAVKHYKAIVDTTEIDTLQHGLIAQEVEIVFPTFVKEINRGSGAYKVINYEKLLPVLIAAIQELSEKVTALEEEKNG